MSWPKELRTALLEILYWTMLEVRMRSQEDRYCFILADHAHNIPRLIDRPLPELLFYYWEIERPCFISALERLGAEPWGPFRDQWQIIEPIYERIRAATHKVPAIAIESESNVASVINNEEGIRYLLNQEVKVSQLRVLDCDGIERVFTSSAEGDYSCKTKKADVEEIRRLLLMFGATQAGFDPTVLQQAKYASDMFNAYFDQ